MAIRDNMVYSPLRNVSIQYKNEEYIAEEIFPSLIVSPKAQLTTYDRGNYFRDEAGPRNAGAAALRGNPTTSYVNIFTTNYAFGSECTDEDRADAKYQNSPNIKPEIDAIEYATLKLLLHKEVLVSQAVVSTTSSWSGLTGGSDVEGGWALGTNCTFFEDIHTAINTIIQNTGIRPNRLLLSFNTFNQLQQESTVLSRIASTSRGIVTADLLKDLFQLDKVIIATTISNSTDQGTTDSHTGIYLFEQNAGRGSAFLYYWNPNVGLKKKNAGYICTLKGNNLTRGVYRYRDAEHHTDIFEANEEFSIESSFAPDLGYLFTDTIDDG